MQALVQSHRLAEDGDIKTLTAMEADHAKNAMSLRSEEHTLRRLEWYQKLCEGQWGDAEAILSRLVRENARYDNFEV